MKKIVLISCVKQKLDKPAKVKELYVSDLFRKFLAYAETLSPDTVFILSAKYGLLNCEEMIEPYELTLNTMGVRERKDWSGKVIDQLGKVSGLRCDKFIFLAGERYRQYLLPHISHYEIPLQGLRVGEQKQWLKRKIRNAGM